MSDQIETIAKTLFDFDWAKPDGTSRYGDDTVLTRYYRARAAAVIEALARLGTATLRQKIEEIVQEATTGTGITERASWFVSRLRAALAADLRTDMTQVADEADDRLRRALAEDCGTVLDEDDTEYVIEAVLPLLLAAERSGGPSGWREVFTPERAEQLTEWVDGLPSNAGAQGFSHVGGDNECLDDCPACSLLDLIASRGAVGP